MTLTNKLAALACTLVATATLMLGAVGPATAMGQQTVSPSAVAAAPVA